MQPLLLSILLSLFALKVYALAPEIDLSDAKWDQGHQYKLEGLWNIVPGEWLAPDQLHLSPSQTYPVPEFWGRKSKADNPPPALGVLTYHQIIRLPAETREYYLYLSDMPSAYVLWANGEKVAANGTLGRNQNIEEPGFRPRVIKLPKLSSELQLVIHLSNFHYREGGIWFSPRITDESGAFAMSTEPLIWATFLGGVLLALGVYNVAMFAFRKQELAALYFGLLCLVIGLRRLLIDERILYLFDWFSWASLQRVEHLCFYLALPLFVSFFTALYERHLPTWVKRSGWLTILPFVFLCTFFPARVYTELNVSFQMLVMMMMSVVLVYFVKIVREDGQNTKSFGISLLICAITVTHDVLKANGFTDTQNIAHLGILAFIFTQSFSLQRRYLNNLNSVEKMSAQLETRNQELIALDEFKDEFLATTSHELRTPLQGISGLAQTLEKELDSDTLDEHRKKIQLIAHTSKRLSILVNDILDFSSIKHGELKLNLSVVDLQDLADNVLGTIRPTLGNKAIKLSAHIEAHCQYFRADAYRLQQILFNLIGNAVKYTEKGEISWRVFSEAEKLQMDISDTGVGIPAEKQAHLFKPFEQTHVEGHLNASGTGLGLSISQRLVELHGGNLSVQSEVGKGTVVHLEFPVASIESAPTTQAELRPPEAYSREIENDHSIHLARKTRLHDHEPVTVWIIDDEALNCELVVSVLKTESMETRYFTDGLSALKQLRSETPDLIILDYMMPKMNGLQVCETIRQSHSATELPIIMLTARHQTTDIVKALSIGANDYLTKPFNDKELIARVNSLISIRRHWLSRQENQQLKKEIVQRKKLEEQLADTYSQLLQSLDMSHEIVLRLDADLRIQYANQQASAALASEKKSLIGESLDALLDEEHYMAVKDYLANSDGNFPELTLKRPNGNWHLVAKRFSNDTNAAYILLIQEQAVNEQVNEGLEQNLNGLSHALSASRQRIDEIELALQEITHPIPAAQPAVPSTSTVEPINAKDQVSELLRMALALWEQYTGKGKVELAEMSRCWRVYVDGTTVKTRTFDKYLSAKSIPDNPRWRAVVRTAHFVLSHCSLEEPDANKLRALTTQVEAIFV